MELWIRSQDKSRLLKAESICIDGFGSKIAIFDNNKCVGTYESEQRCLEILDEIQKLLDNDPMCLLVIKGADISNDDYNTLVKQYKENKIAGICFSKDVDYNILNKTSIVYQMPEK